VGVALCAIVLLVAAAACGGSDDGDGAPDASTAAVTQTETVPTEPATTAAAGEPGCAKDDLSAAVRQALGDYVGRVEVVRCRNGYARATAYPEEATMETADVLLRLAGDTWEIVDFGTSIGCEETPLPPAPEANRDACAALGYPQPGILTGASFQLPSRNIGCRSGGGALRCDILSGLVPEPSRPCELDWVGILLPITGPAAPNCAGDTAYDGAAPVLAYGDLWQRGGIWCRSSETGLLCVNRDVEGSFELARERWSAN